MIEGGSAFYGGAGIVATALVSNTGTIRGGAGVGASIAKAGVGVSLPGGGTVVNGGLIAGGVAYGKIAQAIYLGAGPSRLIVNPGAVFAGAVVAAGTAATLELASGAQATIIGLGTSFSGFGTISVDAGGDWTVAGAVTGTAAIGIGAGADLLFESTVDAASRVTFLGNAGTLRLQDPAGFDATLFDFGIGDVIDFITIADTGNVGAGVNASNRLTLTSNGSLLASIRLDPAEDFSNVMFQVSAHGSGTAVTEMPLCFLSGTMITTPGGATPIEALRPGDHIITVAGAARPVVWVGAGRVLAVPGRRSAATPVIIRKGALAANVPNRDLRLTKAHALWLDGVLIPVEFLVNHRSILWDDVAREVSLYHVELESHDVVLANGAPAESYRDDGNRWLFHNANDGWDLPPQPPCAPVLTGGPIVDAVWRRLLDRAGPRPGVPQTQEPDLHLVVDGQRVDPAVRSGSLYLFRLASLPTDVHLVSRAGSPAELGFARDPRMLGVALRTVRLRHGAGLSDLSTKDAGRSDGLHDYEPDLDIRWTDGDARLQLPLFDGVTGACEIEVVLGGQTWYPLVDTTCRGPTQATRTGCGARVRSLGWHAVV